MDNLKYYVSDRQLLNIMFGLKRSIIVWKPLKINENSIIQFYSTSVKDGYNVVISKKVKLIEKQQIFFIKKLKFKVIHF